MASGLTADGFSVERFPEIRARIISELQSRTGYTFETESDSMTGRFIDVFTDMYAEAMETAQAVYSAMYPRSAEGKNLDDAVAFSGARRISAKRTTVYATILGRVGEVIQPGFSIRSTDSKKVFQAFRAITISKERANQAILTVRDAATDQNYSLTINGATFDYNAVAGTNGNDIAIQLQNKLAAAEIAVVRDGDIIEISTANPFDPMVLETSNNIESLNRIGNLGTFYATEAGPIEAPVGMVTEMINTQAGIVSVYNPIAGVVGRYSETDPELRIAYKTGVFRLGAGNINAIRANILDPQNCPNVTYCQVYQNSTATDDAEGRPRNSMELVVVGGEDQNIADEYFRVFPGGTEMFGSIVMTTKDSGGNNQEVRFNRPMPVYIWIKVNIERYNEEDFPGNGAVLINKSIVATGNSLGVGKDVIPQRFYGDIYSNVSGIKTLEVLIARSANPTSEPAEFEYQQATYPISVREIAQFNEKRIDVQVL